MEKRLHIPKLGSLALGANTIMHPIMRRCTYPGESPQLTHFWNNMKLPLSALAHLDERDMVEVASFPDAMQRRRWDPRWHLPRFGGWKNYVVLEPAGYEDGEWFVGWKLSIENLAGVSLIPVYGRVRVLIGPSNVTFFGMSGARHRQIRLRLVAEGVIGEDSAYTELPLH